MQLPYQQQQQQLSSVHTLREHGSVTAVEARGNAPCSTGTPSSRRPRGRPSP